MEKSQIYDFVILGGGIAGLTFARQATRGGKRVVVLESADRVGGLSRTFDFEGYRFDIGGHRLVSPWPQVIDWVREEVHDELVQVARRSHIFLNGRYIDYPLQVPNALFAFPPLKALEVLASYLGASLRSRIGRADASFEDWVVRRFGRSLYEIYFRPYTEKVWGTSCGELASEFAVQRIKVPSLAAAVRGSLFHGTAPAGSLVSQFYYPAQGFGTITDRLAESVQAGGLGEILVNSPVHRLEQEGEDGGWRVYYRQGGEERCVSGRQVISTIPLDRLFGMLPRAAEAEGLPVGELIYRSMICVCLAVDAPQISDDTWTYFPDSSLIFGRTHEPSNWSAAMVPPGKTSLVTEIFCTVGDAVWDRSDADITGRVVADLERLELVTRRHVEGAWLVRVPYAYPVYRLGYQDRLNRLREYLTRWPTLHLAGRTGMFRYLNADGVIKHTLELAAHLVK